MAVFYGLDVLQSEPEDIEASQSEDYEVDLDNFIGSVQYPNIKYSPEEIFSGKSDLLSIDFISGKNAAGQDITGDWVSIRVVISQWYKVLRMIAIIGLLSVLIYTGIKVIISSNSKDKAKYKEWIINWFMAVAILFSMHYIMSFIISVTSGITQIISTSTQGINVIPAERK